LNDDRINEVFYGQSSDPQTQALARERLFWMAAQVVGERVLDLGCSQGIGSILMAREGRRVVGVDREAPAIAHASEERAREPLPVRRRLGLLRGEGASLPFRSSVFDTAVLGEVIEHLEDPPAVLAEVARVLKPEGRVVVTTPFGFLPHDDHRQTFYPASLLSLLAPFFTAQHLDIQGSSYLRYVGAAGGGEPRVDRAEIVRLAEERMLAKERRYVERSTRLREELWQAAEKYRRATERNERLMLAVSGQMSASEGEERGHVAIDLEVAQRQIEELATELGETRSDRERSAAEHERLRTEHAKLLQRFGSAEERLRTTMARNRQLDKQFKQLALRLRVFDRSRSWKLIRLYWRVMNELVRGDRGQRKAFVASGLGVLRRRLGSDRRAKRKTTVSLDQFLAAARAARAPAVVFLFSGTTFIQEHRGNRPIRLARLLRARGVPVLFSYWRWRKSEPVPEGGDERLLQLPIDLTLEQMERIAAADFAGKKKIFVVTFPHLACARYLHTFIARGWQTIYDVRDDWEEFHQVGAAKWYREGIERYIANNVEVVTAVSRPLQAKIQGYLREGTVHLSPNALDTRFLERRVQVRPRDGRKVIGYVGHLTAAWFDWEALVHVARTRPDWTVQVVGHSEPKGLELPANLELLGPRDYRQIMEIARGWRAALIPFKICRLSDGVDPIKVYEYLAMGLPVVSFRMPQIHDYPYVFIAHDRDQFVARIEEALEVDMDPEVIRRFLAVNRWEDRVDQILSWPAEPRLDPIRAVGTAAGA
jgi:SAM-dependent methyltransferase/glycosyltransferase involved in cell wall biosynthesis